MNQVIEPTVSLNDSLYSDILQQSIFCLAISMAKLIRTTRIHETVPARKIIGMPETKQKDYFLSSRLLVSDSTGGDSIHTSL